MELLQALNAASALLQRSAQSEQALYRAFSEQIGSIDLAGGIALLDDTKKYLVIRSVALPASLFSGLQWQLAHEFQDVLIPVAETIYHQHVLETGNAVFIDDSSSLSLELLPPSVQSMVNQVLEALGPVSCLMAPIKTEGKVSGLLFFISQALSVADLPVAESFANHFSVALDNARLIRSLAQIDAQYRRLYEAANDAILLIDPHTRQIISFNPKTVELTGYHEDELIDMPLATLYSQEQAGEVERLFEMVLQQKTGVFILTMVRRDKNQRQVECSVTMFDSGGRYLLQNIMHDVTESKLAMDSLRIREQTLRQTVEQSKQMEAALRRRAEELAVLHTVSLDITAALGLPELLKTVVERATGLLNGYGGILYLNESENKLTRCVVSHNTFSDYKGKSLHFGEGAAGLVAQTGESLIIDDYRLFGTKIDVDLEVQGQTAVLTVPMIVRGQVIGVLQVVDDCEKRQFNTTDQEMLTLFADQAAIAIENARLLQAERAARIHAETLREVARVLSGSLDLKEVLHLLQEQLARVLVFDTTSVVILDDEGQPELIAGFGYHDEALTSKAATDLLKESPIIKKMAGDFKPVVHDDVRNEPDWIWVPGAEHVRSFLAVPIIARQRMIGVLMADSILTNFYKESDTNTAQSLAQHMAVAIENARFFEQAQVERRHLSLLYDVGRELVTSLDSDIILERALTLTCNALGGTIGEAFLYIPTEQRLSWRAIYGVQLEPHITLESQTDLGLDNGLSGYVALNRKAVNVPDLSKDPHWLNIPGLDAGASSAISAPIMDETRLLGVISVLHHQKNAFNDDHLELLQAICQQVSLALNNAERYHQVESLVDLLASEQYRLETLIERLPLGVLMLDHQHRLLISNPLGLEIISFLKCGTLGETLFRLGNLPLSEIISRHKDPLPVEISWEGPPYRIYEAQARSISGDTQWLLTIRDVTKERENQVRIQMQERLATVGQLAAGIAHDFNNIMAAILVYTDLLTMDSSLSHGSRDRLHIIRQQVQRASSLIRQILDFSRRSLMEQSPIDLLPFLKELDKLLKRLLPETIHLDLLSHPDVYMVSADPTRLQQVFMNLAVNARDAMPSGGVLRFEISKLSLLHQQEPPIPELPPGNWVVLSIRDTGEGIPPEVMPHIFEPFFTTKSVGEGTGLGLAQVYGIIKQHKGFIDVTSQVGSGTTFTIFLPALESDVADEAQQEAPSIFDGSGATVLLVEDDDATREALQELLAEQNYWVLAASNGLEALRIYSGSEGTISLVISDVVMPEMGGLNLYNKLKEITPQVKMLFITGHPIEVEDQTNFAKGCVRWLQKPFSVLEFSQVVQALLVRS
jgi:PAS domain S-box-containing protein